MTLSELTHALNRIESQTDHAKAMAARGMPFDTWIIKKEGKKFVYLDCGTSGAFLIEKTTGELFNIKGYGVPDYNKKQKANIGNVATVEPETLHRQRYNYLR